jgi:hypothetical protein
MTHVSVLPIRLAMWSGPRNISTALMRSFGNRPDTAVIDEPFYACYLERTGLDHPGRDEVLAHQPRAWETVIEQLLGPVPEGKSIWYQKHMAHHMLNDCPLTWLEDNSFRHVFLIRRPQQMLNSLLKVLGEVTIDQTGLPQQARLYQAVRRAGTSPVVIDAQDVLDSPATTLAQLCQHLGIPFLTSMLHWPAGPRATDGVWAQYWYDRVNQSTCFAAQPTAETAVPVTYQGMLRECEDLYAQLADSSERLPKAGLEPACEPE